MAVYTLLLVVDWVRLAIVPPVTVMSLAVNPVTFSENVKVMFATKPLAMALRSDVTTKVGAILSLTATAIASAV